MDSWSKERWRSIKFFSVRRVTTFWYSSLSMPALVKVLVTLTGEVELNLDEEDDEFGGCCEV